MATTYPLAWDETGKRFYETGVSKGVLYPGVDSNGHYGSGVAWNGLTAVNETSDGAEPNALYADDIKYLNLLSNEEFSCTIEAYTYPDEFAECDGSAELLKGVVIGQQKRTPFGFSYVTKVGNDTDGVDKGYKIHLVYNCLAAPTDRNYETINDNPDAITFSWEVSTTPVTVTDITVGEGQNATVLKFKPTASLTIDTTKLTNDEATHLTDLENYLYGTSGTNGEAKLPLPNEVYNLLKTGSV